MAHDERYFVAITPEPAVLDRIEALRKSWGSPHHKVEPHITLKAPFLWTGSPESWLTAVRGALVSVQPFALQLGGPDAFGRNVLFLAVAGESVPALHRAVVDALNPLLPPDPRGQGQEGKGYHAHLTLAVTRLGATPERWPQYNTEAAELAGQLPTCQVRSARVYKWQPGGWRTLVDLPLGSEP